MAKSPESDLRLAPNHLSILETCRIRIECLNRHFELNRRFELPQKSAATEATLRRGLFRDA